VIGSGFVITISARLSEGGVVLAGVKAKPYGWPSARLDPGSGRRGSGSRREQAGGSRSRVPGDVGEEICGVGLGGWAQVLGRPFLILLENDLSSNKSSNRIGVWNSGIQQQTSAQNAVRWIWPWMPSTVP
jgi:hypothetical protein